MPFFLGLSVKLDNLARGLRQSSHKGSWRRAGNGDWIFILYGVRVGRVTQRNGQWSAALEGPFGQGLVPESCDTEAEGRMLIERWRRRAMESDGRVAALLVAECLK